MKIVVLLGSPRKNGNTETLVQAAVGPIEQDGGSVEYIRLNDLNLRPCQGCGGCDKTGSCVIKDDMTDIYSVVDGADRIFLVSPVYFYGLSAQCKIFGDRMQARWARRYLLKDRYRQGEGRKGYLIASAATKGSRIFECSILTTRYIFDAIDVEYGGEFVVKGVDKRKAVLGHPDEVKRAEAFGKDILADHI